MAFFAITFFFKAFFTLSTKPHNENCGNKDIKYGSIKGRNCVTVKLKTIYFRYITPYYCNQILSCCFFFASFCAFKRTVVIEFYFYFWFNKSTFMWQSKLHILNV